MIPFCPLSGHETELLIVTGASKSMSNRSTFLILSFSSEFVKDFVIWTMKHHSALEKKFYPHPLYFWLNIFYAVFTNEYSQL